jgi:hypothetical protein
VCPRLAFEAGVPARAFGAQNVQTVVRGDFDKPSEGRRLSAEALVMSERLGEHVLHGVLCPIAVAKHVGAATEYARAELLVEFAQFTVRSFGRQALLAWDDLDFWGLAAGHGPRDPNTERS